MTNNDFYKGVLFELEKCSQTVPTIGGQPSINMGAPAQAPLPTPNVPKLPPPASTQMNASAPTSTASQPTAKPSIWNLSDPRMNKLKALHATNQMVNKMTFGYGGKMFGTQKMEDDGVQQAYNTIQQEGVDKIRNSHVTDFFGNQHRTPDEQNAADLGMANPAVSKAWNDEMSKKTYGLGELDEHGNPHMGNLKNFQLTSFLKDNWPWLAGLLGVGAGGWMLGQSGQQQQPQAPVINLNMGGMGNNSAPQPQFI